MKIIGFLLFIALLVPRVSRAQVKNDTPVFNHAAICVRDLKKSTDFYRSALKLEEIPNPFNDGIHSWFKIGPTIQLHVIQRDCVPTTNKNSHLCFSVASLETFMSHLEKRGVSYTNLPGTSQAPTTRADGVKQIYLQDPDGYWIEVNNAR